jgi:Protein of unknown function (DUF2840)
VLRSRTLKKMYLTTVYTQFLEGVRNYRILFGVPLRWVMLREAKGETVKVYYFKQGSRFALDLWARNTYGTIQWRCFVCEAIAPGIDATTVPYVKPGARVLLSTHGAAQSRLFLAWLGELEGRGMNPLSCPPEVFESAHFRLQGSRADKTHPKRLSGLT